MMRPAGLMRGLLTKRIKMTSKIYCKKAMRIAKTRKKSTIRKTKKMRQMPTMTMMLMKREMIS